MQLLEITKHVGAMNRLARSGKDAVRAAQDVKLRGLLRHAASASPFHGERLRGLDLDRCDLRDVPIMTKSTMMEHFEDALTVRDVKLAELRAWLADEANMGKRYLDKYIPIGSSGTTGLAGITIYDEAALNHVFAAMVSRQALPRSPSPGQQLRTMAHNLFVQRGRLAIICVTGGGVGTHTLALHAPRFQNKFVETRVMPTSAPTDELVRMLNEYDPDTLISYPSTVEVLAQEKIAGRLRIRLDSPVSSIICGGEPTTPRTRRLVKEAWGIEPEDSYGLSECMFVARTCSRFDGLHIADDLVVLEVVDRENRPVPDGARGDKVLLTSLTNRIQPIIRYEVTDVTGISTEPCACGSPYPKLLPIEGRTNDALYIDRPGGGYEQLNPMRLGFLLMLRGLKRYQVVQTQRNRLRLDYVPAEDGALTEQELRSVVESGLREASLSGRVDFDFRLMDGDGAPTKKSRLLVTDVGPPAGL